MAKKNLKRGLALGALMAFVITGSAMAASVRNDSLTDVTSINASSDFEKPWGEASDRSYAYAADDGNTYSIKSEIGSTVEFVNELIGYTRNYGIALENKSSLIIDANVSVKTTIDSEGSHTRAIRNNKGNNLIFNGNATITSINNKGLAIGVDGWNNSITEFNGENTIIDVTAGADDLYGVQARENAKIIFNGKNTTINGKTTAAEAIDPIDGPRPDGYYQTVEGLYTNGTKTSGGIYVNSDNLTITSSTDPNDSKYSSATAVRSEGYGKIIFGDNVNATLNAITNKGESTGIWTSYYTEAVFGGKSLTINSTSNEGAAIGVISVWNAVTKYTAETIKINTKSISNESFGIYVNNHTQSAPKHIYPSAIIDFNGAVEINSESQNENAYGVYVHAAKANADDGTIRDNGGGVKFTAPVTINVKSANKSAYGIYASAAAFPDREYDGIVYSSENGKVIVDVDGLADVSAKGAEESVALYAEAGAEINLAKASSIIGDIVSNESKIEVIGEAVKFEGKTDTIGNGTVKLNIGKGTWNITDASTLTDVTFGAGSTLTIDDGSKYTGSNYAVTASGKAEVEEGAKLIVNGVKEETYNIVKAGTINGKWAESDITIDNALMSYEWSAEDASKLDLVVKPKSADEITNSTGVNSSTGSMLSDVVNMASSDDYNKGDNAGVDFIVNAMAGQASGNTPQAAGASINSALQIGEAGGNSATSVSVVNNVTGITTQRMSFSQMSTAPQGGHGKVERKYKTGAGIWAQYMHGKDKVEDMPLDGMKSSYDSQYNGAVIGYDFAEIGKVKYGIAFNYGEGDSHSKNSSISTRSDFDFWGIGLYSSIMNDDTNVIFDINYSKSDSDVTQINGATTLEANPETTSLSAGVKFEKLIQKDTVQVVPYAGLRFMTVDTDDYAANIAGKKAFMYAPERQNIWLIPVGVSLRQENSYENGWKVTPKADLSYIWAIGDTDSSMTVSIPGITNVSSMNYTVMDNGSFLGTLGIEAEKGDWTYGLSYSYQKGEYQRSDKWFVDVRYSF